MTFGKRGMKKKTEEETHKNKQKQRKTKCAHRSELWKLYSFKLTKMNMRWNIVEKKTLQFDTNYCF